MSQTSALQILITVLGSGALFSFLQFMITRKDTKEKNNIDSQLDELKEEFQEGLEERERTSSNRYEEHKIAIEKINIQHQKDFQLLNTAIQQLTVNDQKITENIQKISDQQDTIAASLIGTAHDRILFLTDKISERGSITLREKATINSMYKPYRELGGNGMVKESVDYVYTLPVVGEEEAKKLDIEMQRKQAKEILS